MNKRDTSDIRALYRSQIKKFDAIGIGNKTENNVVVTEELIAITHKRLMELQGESLRKLRKPVEISRKVAA